MLTCFPSLQRLRALKKVVRSKLLVELVTNMESLARLVSQAPRTKNGAKAGASGL